MTIRHIRIFLAVCSNDCNTTRAAEHLHLAQPAGQSGHPGAGAALRSALCSTASGGGWS